MSAAVRLDHTYRYPFASALAEENAGWGLRLATGGGASTSEAPHPFFFDGLLREPKIAADMLCTLAKVVNTRYFLPLSPLALDPVVTSSEEVLRFEGFSSCCGVYVRADLKAESFDSEIQGRGTTNVDFNLAMRGALARVRSNDQVRLAVGADQVRLSAASGEVIERKVALPVRWLKGFTEVQAYQPTLDQRFEVSAAEGKRFIRDLGRGGSSKQPCWVTPLGKGLRLSQREAKGAVRVVGTERLRVLEPLLPLAKSLRVWANDDSGVSAWQVIFDAGDFWLIVSPEIYRGFSGEGQALTQLATKDGEQALPLARAALRWQSRIDPTAISRQANLEPAAVTSALAMLGSRGLVGYDLGAGAYFHRELPFDMERVEDLHPRLKAARQLVAEAKVKLVKNAGGAAELVVQGSEAEHLVRLSSEGPAGDRCTCPWFSKNQGQRGPCKHILAARIQLDGDEDAA
jgi:hypothetical protein